MLSNALHSGFFYARVSTYKAVSKPRDYAIMAFSVLYEDFSSGKWHTVFFAPQAKNSYTMLQKETTAGETAVQVFTYNEKDMNVRIQSIDGNPWFVVKDLCEILEHSNHKVAIQGLDEDEVSKVYLTDSLGRQQETLVVNESGMYALVIRSNKPQAKKFRKWVTSEVLPAIRKTGRYELKKSAPAKTHNYPRRGELITADLVNLLWLIGESLEHGDQAQIALELGVSRNTVSGTLNGKIRSSRVLRALYRKAMQRREEFMLYHRPDKMAERLIGGDRSSLPTQLPTVHIAGCKGLLGCQNARKKNKKGGAL